MINNLIKKIQELSLLINTNNSNSVDFILEVVKKPELSLDEIKRRLPYSNIENVSELLVISENRNLTDHYPNPGTENEADEYIGDAIRRIHVRADKLLSEISNENFINIEVMNVEANSNSEQEVESKEIDQTAIEIVIDYRIILRIQKLDEDQVLLVDELFDLIHESMQEY